MPKFKQLTIFKDSIIYALSAACLGSQIFLTTPILTRSLDKPEFAIFDLATSFINLFIGLIVLGQDSAVATFIRDNDKHFWNRIITTGLLIETSVLILASLIFATFGDAIGGFIFNNNNEIINHWKIAVLIIPFQLLQLFGLAILKWTFKKFHYLFITFVHAVLNVGFTYTFVVILNLGLKSAIIAPIISYLLSSLIALFFIRKYIDISELFSKPGFLKSMLRFGLPLSFVGFFGAAISVIDRFFLIKYVPETVIADYSLGVKLATVMLFFNTAFSGAFLPHALSEWNNGETFKKLFSSILRNYFFVMTIVIALLSIFAQPLLELFSTKEYLNAINIFRILLLSRFFEGFIDFTYLGIYKSKKTYLILCVLSSSIFFLLISNALLVPQFLIYGSAFSLLFTRIIVLITSGFLSNKQLSVDFHPVKFLLMVLLLSTVLYACTYNILIANFLLLVYVYVYYFFMYNLKERHNLQLYIKDRIKVLIGKA